jgi:cytochrome c-type biogenesis protein CcmH/NrfG
MRCAPDDPLSHYNLGVYHQNRGELMRAVAAYETAVRLEPTMPALVNVAMIYARLGRTSDAEQALRRAVELEPTSPAANFNLAVR